MFCLLQRLDSDSQFFDFRMLGGLTAVYDHLGRVADFPSGARIGGAVVASVSSSCLHYATGGSGSMVKLLILFVKIRVTRKIVGSSFTGVERLGQLRRIFVCMLYV